MTSPISFNGLGSGLDIQGIVAQLMKIERQPLDALTRQKTAYQQSISTLGEFESAASKLKAAADKLASSAGTLGKMVASSNESLLTATVLPTAHAATYSIRVNHLATTAKVASVAVADKNVTNVGAGPFTIQVGTPASGLKTTTIDFEGGSLEDLRSAINASDAGVTVSILHDSAGDRLVLTSKDSGLKGAVSVTNGLSGGDAALTFSTTVTGVDASVEIDGVELISSSNKLSGVIEGVTINLHSADISKTLQLEVKDDKEGLKASLQAFVDGYNAVKKLINSEGKSSGKLAGSPFLMSMDQQMRSLIAGTGARGIGRYETLGQLGVKTERDGALSLDGTVLTKALDEGFEDVAKLLRLSGSASNPAVGVATAGTAEAGLYAIQITQAASRGEWSSLQTVDPVNGLSQAETLSFTSGSKTASIVLAPGDKLSDIVAKVNTGLASAGIGVKASDSGGALRLRTDEYGSAQSFTVVSDVADGAGSTGIGTSVKNATGQDIAGTIGGLAATGSGQVLTGQAGTAIDGLGVRVNALGAGSYGSVKVGGGVMNAISKQIQAVIQSGNGVTTTRKSSLRTSIRSLDLRLEQMSNRLDRREQSLLLQFQKADSLMGQLNGQGGSLSSQIAAFR